MTDHPVPQAIRRLVRAALVAPAVVLLTAAPAVAAPPEQWAEADDVSALSFLLVVLLIPAGLFIVIALLSWLPSMGKSGSGYSPGLAWRHEPEWFGGPRDGVARAEEAKADSAGADDRGGASGRW